MKVDTSRLKKGTSEVPPECQHLIDRLRQCTRLELALELSRIETWTFGKCELYHWIDILDIFDTVLEEATEIKDGNDWCLACDQTFGVEDKRLLLYVLNFTTLLIEHSFSRHLYNSVEHLTRLLSSSNMEIVLGVLNLLYMFSKRSNFISRLNSAKKNSLLARLNHIAENWGGKDCGFGLANCCRENIQLPTSSSTFYYEYYDQDGALQTIEIPALDQSKQPAADLAKEICAKIDDLDDDQKMHIFTRIRLSLSFHNYIARLQFVQARLQSLSVLVYSNSLQENIHTLLYSGFLEELVELLEMKDTHLVEIRAAALRTLTSIIHLDRNPHFPKKPGSRLAMIIDVTGASSYHGFLPTLVRNCIQNLTLTSTVLSSPADMATSTSATTATSNTSQPMIINDDDIRQQQKQLQQLQLQTKMLYHYQDAKQQLLNLFPLPLATALFSFLYHLASYETGGEALVACGMMESLLRVINWPGYELEHITFVTRAVRVIDLITNIDMQSFQNHGGLNSFIGRLDMEVNFCRREQPFEIEPQHDQQAITNMNLRGDDSFLVSDDTNMSTDDVQQATASTSSSSSSYSSTAVKISTPNLSNSLQSFEQNSCNSSSSKASKNSKTCLPQRAALLKSMLNFLKKAIQDPAFSDSIRHVMEGTLPNSLRHIISNAEYYGPSLFLLATDVVTVYVFQEPSLLSSLQDNGLTDVVLQALLKKDVPATREVLGSLPNVFSALCLNARGLLAFVKYDPFDRLFKVLLSPVYLMAMRRRRSSDPMGDTASNLGNAMDELMRHQPSLKPEATKAIIKLLEELVILGTDSKYICWRATNKNEASPAPASRQSSGTSGNDAGSSDEEDDDEEEASTSSHHNQRDDNSNHDGGDGAAGATSPTAGGSSVREAAASSERTPIPLIDYILNVMKFVDAILSNNSTDDHCREFVSQDGLQPLLSILALPNLPVDSPITASAQAVAAVCKSILNLAHEGQVLQVGLEQLSAVVEELKPLQAHIASPGGSVLLRELANCPNIDGAFSNASYTPLLHAMSAVHGYVVMLVHVCRTGQSDIRSLLLKKWGTDTRYGKKLLKNLVELYTALVWESTLLLALCTDDIFPSGCEFGKEDIEKLPSDNPEEKQSSADAAATSNNSTTATTSSTPSSAAMEQDDGAAKEADATKQPPKKKMIASPGQLRYIKALLGASSRLGRALAELFGNLVKLCVGSPIRQRRGQNFPPTPAFTSSDSRDIARVLSYILVDGFSYKKLKPSPIPKLKLTFLICSVGFTGPMLFDEKRYAFHLMLHKFVQEGGLDAFFGMFEWAVTSGWTVNVGLTLENASFPEGTGEFLDAWLMLLEKMVNPKAILESPHVINNSRSSRGKNDFDGIQYLSMVHRLGFSAVTRIWGMKPIQTYGVRMTESMMSILKHVLKGEKLIREKSKKRQDLGQEKDKSASVEPAVVTPTTTTAADPVAGNSSGGAAVVPATISQAGTSTQPTATSSAGGAPALVNQDHLKQLMDMGFNREHVTDALLHTATVEQATEYLLSNPPPPPPPPVIGELPTDESSNSMDLDLDLPRRADDGEDDRTVLALPTPENPHPSKYYLSSGPPLTDEIIVPFSYVAVRTSLYLMDALPETVPKGTELLAILFRRNRFGWKTDMLRTIVEHIVECLKKIAAGLQNETGENIDGDIYYGATANKFHVRIHIYSIFMDEVYPDIRVPAIQVLKAHNVGPKLIEVFLLTEKVITRRAMESGGSRCGGSPKWLAQLVVFLDLYEKVAVYTQRRADMHKVTTKIWKWYDVASGKWNAYSVSNNKIINDAYFTGESSIRISCGRQRYAINFNCMSQVNEETGNHRPVILALKATEGRPSLSSDDEVATDSDDDDITTEQQPKKVKKSDPYPLRRRSPPPFIENDFTAKLIGLDEFDTGNLVSVCVRLMTPPIGIDRDTLHAIMKLCVRLTKSFDNADIFAKDGGVRLLLNMRQTCSYIGFPTLSILLIRHVLEEPRTLALAMERVIATRTIQTIPPGYRDLVFLLRQMSSAVSRDPKTFKEVAQAMLRIDISVLRRNSLSDDNRLLLKSVPNVKRFETMEESASVQVVQDLLTALIVPCVHLSPSHSSSQLNQDQPTGGTAGAAPPATAPSSSSVATAPTTCHSIQPQQNITIEVNNPFQHLSYPPIPPANPTRRITTAGNASIGGTSAAVTADMNKLNENEEQCCGWHIPCATHEHDKPLLPRATILKFLADAVRSYQTFAPLITEHVYKAGDSPLITEDTSALSFILDKLLPITELTSDREVTSMSRALIAALASCSEQPTVQYTVVTEVKAAINRALALPESADKHSQLQILAAIIPTMIENCPPENTALLKLHHLQPRRNDIFYIMVRKGLITDLAKLTQYLDLSSPHTIATVNSALKPLETLLRMTNQPGPVPLSAKAKKAGSQQPEGVNAVGGDDEGDDGDGAESNSVGSRLPTTHMDEDDEDLQGDDDSSSQQIPPTTIQRNRLVASAIAEYASALEEHLGEAANVDQDEIAVENEVITRQQSNDGTQVNLEDIMDQLLEQSSGNDRNASQISGTVEIRGGGGVGSGDENIDVDFNARVETSSESGDSDSNGSDNEEREIDDEDENEEEAEDRSEIDVDEETRQFIELYDHVYGRHLSPSIPELERDTDDILMIRYPSLNNQAEQGTVDGTVESNTNQSLSMAGGENGNTTTSGMFHNTFPNIFETITSGGAATAGTSGGPSASTAGQQSSSVGGAAARTGETAGVGSASLRLPTGTSAATSSSSGRPLHHLHILGTRSLPHITSVTLNSGNAADRSGGPTSAAASEITRTTGTSSGGTGAGSSAMQPQVNVTLASQLQSSVASTGALSAAAAHHRQHTMSLGQRLVAVTRTFRTQLANTVAETNNMRQRRYQLLNLNSRNTPIILQRLLGNGPQNGTNAGTGSNQDNSDGNAGTSGGNSNANAFRDATRVVLMDNAFGIFSHTDEGSIDLVDQAGYLFGRSLAATLSSTPTALHWWLEEAKALGLESQSDICLSVADSLIPELEMQKALELAKIRGKKKKKQAEEEAAKAAAAAAAAAVDGKEKENGTQTPSASEQAMETSDHNFEQSSNDNARNFVIGMDTIAATESSNQDDSNTAVNAVLEHLQREISGDDSDDLDTTPPQRIPRSTNGGGGSGASAVQNEAMSATSTSDFISDTEHETDDGRTSPTADFSSIILPLEDDENDDENDEDDEEDDDEDEDDDDDDDEEEEEDDDDDDEIEEDDDDVIRNTNSSDQDSSEMDNAVVVFNRRSGGGNDGDEDEEDDNVETDRHRRRRRRPRNPPPENQNQNSSSNQSQPAAGGQGGGGNRSNPDLGEIGSIGESEGTTGERQESGGEIDSSGQNDDEDATTSLANLHSMMIDESDLIPLPAIDDDEDDDDDEDELDDILHMLDNQANIPRRRPIAIRTTVPPVVTAHQDDSVANEQNRTNETQEEEGAVGGVDLSSTTAASTATTTTTILRQSTSTSTDMPPPSQAPSASRAATASSSVLGDLEIPEGVDPSFLAALPQDMREEVIAEHLRLQRLRQRAQQNAIQVEHASVVEVNPEFLAALPLNLQEEVLAQQRIEQQRQAAAATNPNDPVDAAAFFQNLQPSLRQAILTDMEDSQISVLPPDLAAEAQNLRRDWETRNRQMMQERLLNQIGSATTRLPSVRYLYRRPRFPGHTIMRTRLANWNMNGNATDANSTSLMTLMERHGRPLLDHEALTSLLILLFIDEPKFNTLRLHRVIRNLCCHVPTREWIIKALLSIVERSNATTLQQSVGGSSQTAVATRPQWLNIRLDAALGSRANVFVIKKSGFDEYTVSIHPQAAQIVCKHTLDLLITLAKSFPKNFLPYQKQQSAPVPAAKEDEASAGVEPVAPTSTTATNDDDDCPGPEAKRPKTESKPAGSSSSSSLYTAASTSTASSSYDNAETAENDDTTDFWDIIIKLDCGTPERKAQGPALNSNAAAEAAGGSVQQPPPSTTSRSHSGKDIMTFDESPFGQLISMLSFDIVKKSCQLTDKLLRLLSFISVGLPDEKLTMSAGLGTTSSSSGTAAAAGLVTNDSSNSSAASGQQTALPPTATELEKANESILPNSEQQLFLGIEVLTSKSCSEEGLEDATSLLLNMSQCSNQTRTVILNLLIRGAKDLAEMVKKHITDLMYELKELNRKHQLVPAGSAGELTATTEDHHHNQTPTATPSTSTGTKTKGILQDRFTKETVIITAPSKVKQTCDLQLSTMVPLIMKTSSQAFFLRILKVIIQIREAVREANNKEENKGRIILGENELAPLSAILDLDELWDTLSECLLDLEETADNHAVLVLQPAVEAFFLVHASIQSKTARRPAAAAAGDGTDRSAANAAGGSSPTSSSQQEEELVAAAAEAAASPRRRRRPEQPDSADSNSSEPVTLFEITTGPVPQVVPGPALTRAFESMAARASALRPMQQDSVSDAGGVAHPGGDEDDDDDDVVDDDDSSNQNAFKLADQKKFLQFAEKHRTVLNQILRQMTTHLSDGPFAVLVDHTRILDFDVKRRYFRTELERLDEGIRREELAVHVHRVTVFEDSFRELYRRNPEEWKNRFYIVFEDEEGQDAGGLLREWYVIISREIFNPMYALFTVSPGDRVTYMINSSSHANPNHLCYYKFVGRVIAKAIYDNKLLECYFTRSFYKHILGIQVKYTDMESEDYEFYKGLVFLLENHISALGYELTYSLEVQEFGVTEIRDLITNGRNIPVTENNKLEYIHLVCQLKMSGSIRQQLNAFLEGFYDIIPKRLISIFNEQELELLISGLPNVDIEDLKANTEYHKYQVNSMQIQWFWRALRSFDQADRAKFLQFVTGTSKVPLQGFGALEGMNGTQKFQIHRDDRSTDRLPSAHTCFNQLDLPVYKTYDKLRSSLLKAIHECSEGFGFA